MNRAERRQAERQQRLANTRHRHARQPRDRRDPVGHALVRSTCLLPHELDEIRQTLDVCLEACRTATHTDEHITVLDSLWLIAQEIERSGIVRGLQQQITAAQSACAAIWARSEKAGSWHATALYVAELQALQEMADLHVYQVMQLSAGELHRLTKRVIARHQSSGGAFKKVTAETFGLRLEERA